ncbi:MAG: F0F1 ATP synthase subunit delta [Verrucomicrobiae bacterium]|nr:F0F1 ATP synthase subunit delta [Verrucomicrobiae bacterium]
MRVSRQARNAAKDLFRSCFVGGRLDENRVRTVVSELAERKPRGYYEILVHLRRLVRLEIERRTAVVQSACPLSESQRNKVVTRLETIYGSGLEHRFAEDPALIGGLRIKVGSDVYDGSIAGALERLAASF